ncbi:MAG: hypothetical protein Q9162_002286 [Coniocarpon cinnabarinum]
MPGLEGLFDFAETNFTNTIHNELYPAVAPTRPELSQAGRTVLITGGGVGLGFNIGQAFVRAAASTVIIIGRRPEVLEDAKSRLEEEAKTAGTSTKIIARACDVTDIAQVDALWRMLNRAFHIFVDVLVANAAKPPRPKPILEAGIDDIWSFIVNVSSAVIHHYIHPAVAARPGTVLSKSANTLLFQLLGMENPHDKLQVVTYNPGLLWNEYFESQGLTREDFGSGELPGAFAVWAASKQAAFLQGRFVWSSWDAEELATGRIRKQIDEDPYFLRSTIAPLKRGDWA